MAEPSSKTSPDEPAAAWRRMQPVHGGLLLALLALPLVYPGLARWPLYQLVPLAVYAVVVLAVGPLRRTVAWVRVGRLGVGVLGLTLALILVSSTALVAYYYLFRPDVTRVAAQMPTWLPGNLLVAGAFFSVLNAVMEEAVFRGVLLDALESQLGPGWAVLVQGVVFGVVHQNGYPPGPVGVFLAAVYGVLLGWLRLRSGGMAAPVAAHVCADATIFTLVTGLATAG